MLGSIIYATGGPANPGLMTGIKTTKLHRGGSMSDSSTVLAGIAGSLATLVAGILGLRRFLSSDSLARTGDNAQLEVIKMLQDQVISERNRADAAVAARDEAIKQIGQLREQVANLTIEVQSMKAKLGQAIAETADASTGILGQTVK